MSNKLIDWLTVLLVIAALACCVQVCNAENSNLRFSWDAVTLDSNGEPCTDLAGYAIYRSREMDNWTLLTDAETAYIQVDAEITFVTVTCPDSGDWYWIVRAFDRDGNYSDVSDVVFTAIDTVSPSSVFHFRTCQKGDINCDGDINSSDITEFLNVIGE